MKVNTNDDQYMIEKLLSLPQVQSCIQLARSSSLLRVLQLLLPVLL